MENYDDAIKCFNKSLDLDPAYQIAYFKKGECYYRMKDFSSALNDFKRVNDPEYMARTYNNLGACYYQLTLFGKAEEEYHKAIENKTLTEFYYNLAVLYNKNNQKDKSRIMLEKCLEIKPDFSRARDAIKEIDTSVQSEWFEWWFGSGKKKKTIGMVLLISILSLIPILCIVIAYISIVNKSISPHALTGLVVMVAFLVIILLLPSLKKVKVLYVELETMTIGLKQSELDVLLSPKVTFGSI